MAKRKFPSRRREKIDDRDPDVMWMGWGDGYVVPDGNRYVVIGNRINVVRDGDILLQTQLLKFGEWADFGQIVSGTTPSWLALRRELLRDPSLIEYFPGWHRKFEEFVAGGYLASNWSEVILTPRSNDGGFDVA